MNKEISKLETEILGVCKYCKNYSFEKLFVIRKNKHWCQKNKCSVYDVDKCSKTNSIRKKIKELENDN